MGAGVASILWFTALGFGARMLAPLFARPLAWRILDGIIAVVMFAIAVIAGAPRPHGLTHDLRESTDFAHGIRLNVEQKSVRSGTD